MWYKSPELLLGSTRYSNAIDIWSSACVLAELELGRPIFPGKTELEQFDLVSKILGSPNEENWTGLTSLSNYESFLKNSVKYPNIFRSTYDKKISEQAIQLLERIFVLDPDRRPSPKIVLTHNYFFSYPTPPVNPTDLDPLQVVGSLHEYETKLKRKIAAQQITDNPNAPPPAVNNNQEQQSSSSSSASASLTQTAGGVTGGQISVMTTNFLGKLLKFLMPLSET